ncbi:MAG: DUF4340 domain-containing protein [Terracidiphilus sp.]
MRFRGLAIACVVLLALSGVLYWSGHHKKASPASAANSTPVILKVDPASLAGITIRPKDAPPVSLTRQSTGVWQIAAPTQLPADQQTVKDMVSSLSPLNGVQVIETNAANLAEYGLAQPSLELDIGEKNGSEQRLLFGDNTPTGDSAYAMVAGNPRVYTAYVFNKTDLDKTLGQLRDTRLITANPDKMSRIDLTEGGQTIDFGRNSTGNWEIQQPGPYRADALAVDGVADALSGVRMNLTGPGSQNADAHFALGKPVATVKVTAPVGTETLEVRKDNGIYYAKSSVAQGAYQIDPSLAGSLNKKLDGFRNKTVFDFSYNEPSEVDLQIEGSNGRTQSWYLKRSGGDWWLDGKKMDADSVENVVSALRDLTATGFATTGFGKPEIEATVISNRGSLVEKVSIAKTGGTYLAMRANEPTLYVLDGGAVEGLSSAAQRMHPAAQPHK